MHWMGLVLVQEGVLPGGLSWMFRGSWRHANQTVTEHGGKYQSFSLSQWTAAAVALFLYPSHVLSFLSWCVLQPLGLFSQKSSAASLDSMQSSNCSLKRTSLHIHSFRLQTVGLGLSCLNNGP